MDHAPLLLRLGLIEFSKVSRVSTIGRVRVTVMFRFGGRVGVKISGCAVVEFYRVSDMPSQPTK